jgi:Phosphotransferase enzyme family
LASASTACSIYAASSEHYPLVGCAGRPATRQYARMGIADEPMDDINIDEALVRALVREQHPDLAGLELRDVPGGWDNKMWRLGEDWAVRLPRTPRAGSLLRTEQRWLPGLATRLPLPIPTPFLSGKRASRLLGKPAPHGRDYLLRRRPAARAPSVAAIASA